MEEQHSWLHTSFMPHGHCYFWRPDVLWPNVVGDVLTFLAYYSIPVLLVLFLNRRRDIQFRFIFFAFAAFILACGTTHLLAAISVWYPLYYLEGFVKLGTAAVSLFTVGLLITNFQKMLSIPTVAQWEKKNRQLLLEIEERKRKESQLRSSEGKFGFIMKNAPVGMALLGLDGKWMEVNKTIVKMLGYREEELLRMDFQSITHPEDLNTDMVVMEKLLDGRLDNAEFEKRYIKKNGEVLYGLVSAQIIRSDDGTNEFFIAQIVDITGRKEEEFTMTRLNKRLEQEVEARTVELREAYKDMEHFIYAISHDLRVPLNNLGQLAGLIREELERQEVADESLSALDLISENARKMNGLLVDLLEFSRSSLKEVKKKPFDMKTLLEEVMEELLEGFGEKPVRVRIGALPGAYGDRAAISQVCHNLLSNALKYSAQEEEIRIEVSGESKDGFAIFRIKDNGVGFEEEYKGRLFTLFQRLHPSEKFEGSGVGLAICQRIVKKHGGDIWASSGPGKGATFCFSLPEQ